MAKVVLDDRPENIHKREYYTQLDFLCPNIKIDSNTRMDVVKQKLREKRDTITATSEYQALMNYQPYRERVTKITGYHGFGDEILMNVEWKFSDVPEFRKLVDMGYIVLPRNATVDDLHTPSVIKYIPAKLSTPEPPFPHPKDPAFVRDFFAKIPIKTFLGIVRKINVSTTTTSLDEFSRFVARTPDIQVMVAEFLFDTGLMDDLRYFKRIR